MIDSCDRCHNSGLLLGGTINQEEAGSNRLWDENVLNYNVGDGHVPDTHVKRCPGHLGLPPLFFLFACYSSIGSLPVWGWYGDGGEAV